MWSALHSKFACFIVVLVVVSVLCSRASAGEPWEKALHPPAKADSIQEVKIYVCPETGECKVQINVSTRPNAGLGTNCTITLSRLGYPNDTFFYIDRNINRTDGQEISWTVKIDPSDTGNGVVFGSRGITITEGKADVNTRDTPTKQGRFVKPIMDRSLLLYDIDVDIVNSASGKLVKKCNTFGPGIINRG